MMSPGRAQPRQSYQDVAEMYRTPGGGIDMKSYEAHKANLERRKYHGMDPMEAIAAQQADESVSSTTQSLMEAYPHLSPAQAKQLADSYRGLSSGGKWSKSALTLGTPEHRLRDTVSPHWKPSGPEPVKPRLPGPVDPGGDRIRDLMQDSQKPYIRQCMYEGGAMGCEMVPNPEWGKKHGMIWDGSSWVSDDPRKGSAHDMDMQMKQLEMERMRQQIELEKMLAEEELRQKRGSSGVAGGLRDWLNKRLGGG